MRCLSDLSRNVVDALSSWHQSFRQVCYKSAVFQSVRLIYPSWNWFHFCLLKGPWVQPLEINVLLSVHDAAWSLLHCQRKGAYARICECTSLPVSQDCTPASNPLFHNGEENQTVIRNPHADPDHHQMLITSRESSLARACRVLPTSVSAFISYPVYRMTNRTTEQSHNHSVLPCRLLRWAWWDSTSASQRPGPVLSVWIRCPYNTGSCVSNPLSCRCHTQVTSLLSTRKQVAFGQ